MTFVWIAIALVIIVAVYLRLAIPSVDRAVDQTIEERDIRPILAQVEKHKSAVRPTALNHAIRRLWNSYERELAAELVHALAERHSESQIAQYWLKQVMTAEPALARRFLPKGFLDTYYQPEVAARCGPVG